MTALFLAIQLPFTVFSEPDYPTRSPANTPDLLLRSDSAVPQSDGYNSEARLDRHENLVSWYLRISGDYDQNGEVNISDITPLTRHFGESRTQGWEANSIQSVLDGDGNGEINLADITLIARYYGNRIDGWELFLSDGPDTDGFVPGSGEFFASLDETIGDPLTERLRIEHSFEIGPSPFYFIQAVADGLSVGEPELASEPLPHPPRLYTPHHEMAWDSARTQVTWYADLHGDGDRNGEVNAADIAGIAVHFGKSGPFEPGSTEWHTDYDGNGEINLADMDVVRFNFGATTSGNVLYATTDPARLPEPYSYPTLEPVAVSSDYPGLWQEVRIDWNSLPSGTYFWMRPYVGDYNDPVNCGAPSEIIQIP